MISLRVKLPSGRSEKVTIGADSSLEDLSSLISASFLANQQVDLLHGFPPRRLGAEGAGAVVSSLFRHMEPVIVQLRGGPVTSTPSTAAASFGASTAASAAPTATLKKDSTRAASKRKASTAIATTGASTSAAKKMTPIAKSPKLSFGANIHSITSQAGQKKGQTGTKRGAAVGKKSTAGVSSITFGATTSSLNSSRSKTKSTASISATTSVRRKKNAIRAGAEAGNRRRSRLDLTSEEDISTTLLNSVSGGGSSKKNQFLRDTFRRALQLEYEASKAQARVMALISGKYSIRESHLARTLGSASSLGESSQAAQIIVQFHKGHGCRSFYFETVDLLSAAKLRAVIGLLLASSSTSTATIATTTAASTADAASFASSSSTTIGTGDRESPTESNVEEEEEEQKEGGGVGRELLRARYLAQCSPRVFWSLVHFSAQRDSSTNSSSDDGASEGVNGGGVSIPAALAKLMPGEDWSWLAGGEEEEEAGVVVRARRREGLGGGRDGDSVRRRVMSDKARQNHRQRMLAARELQERRDMKRLLSEARSRKKSGGEDVGEVQEGREEQGQEEGGQVLVSSSSMSSATAGATTGKVEYRGPVESAEDMLRALLLTAYDEEEDREGIKGNNQRFVVVTEALKTVFQLNVGEEGGSGGGSRGSSNVASEAVSDNHHLYSHLLHVLADTTLPPLPSAEDEVEEKEVEEEVGSSMTLLDAVEAQIKRQLQKQAQGLEQMKERKQTVDNSSSLVPFVTLSHLRYWIQMARWMLMTHFWAEELDRAAATGIGGAGGGWAEVLGRGGIRRVRDLSLWRHAPADLSTYLCSSDSSSSSCSNPNEGQLRHMCLVAEEFREQCSWVDSWPHPHHDVPLREGSRSWYRDTPPVYCTNMSPEAALCALHHPKGAEVEGEFEAWQTLAGLSSYEEVMGLRRCLPPPPPVIEQHQEGEEGGGVAACLGRRVCFFLSDDGEVLTPGEQEKGQEEEGEVMSGVVVGYLPASSLEPMALWRVLLRSGQFQDLERHELEAALIPENTLEQSTAEY